jgi:hypothetical protein
MQPHDLNSGALAVFAYITTSRLNLRTGFGFSEGNFARLTISSSCVWALTLLDLVCALPVFTMVFDFAFIVIPLTWQTRRV